MTTCACAQSGRCQPAPTFASAAAFSEFVNGLLDEAHDASDQSAHELVAAALETLEEAQRLLDAIPGEQSTLLINFARNAVATAIARTNDARTTKGY